MNPVTEQDLERLEDYLDGVLPQKESLGLEARLSDEADLAAALDELRGQRADRAAVWAALEPGDHAADRFAERVISAARRQDRHSRLWRAGRFGTAAAACLLLGVFMGWLGRERNQSYIPTDTGAFNTVSDVRIGRAVPAQGETLGVVVREIQFPEPPGPPRPVLVVSQVTKAPSGGGPGLQKGDLLISIDGERVPTVEALSAALASRRGMRVLRIFRDGQVHEVAIRFEQ